MFLFFEKNCKFITESSKQEIKQLLRLKKVDYKKIFSLLSGDYYSLEVHMYEFMQNAARIPLEQEEAMSLFNELLTVPKNAKPEGKKGLVVFFEDFLQKFSPS